MNTPEGELLAIVKEMERKVMGGKKGLKRPDLADRDKDGEISSWEATVGRKIEASKAGDPQKAAMTSSTGGTHQPMHGGGGSKEKNIECMGCKGEDPSCPTCGGGKVKKADMGEKDRYCRKHFGKKYSECSPKQKAQCDRECGQKVEKGDLSPNCMMCGANPGEPCGMGMPHVAVHCPLNEVALDSARDDAREIRLGADMDITSEIILKYQQEGSVENASPQFMDLSGGTAVEAHPYQTNGMVPAFTDVAPERSPISEKAKIFAFAKTGYDEKGTGLHLQLSDGGDRKDGNWNIAPIEELLTTLNKSGGDSGLLSEIADLVEKIATQQ